MTKQVLILGATGQIAGHAIDALLENSDDHLLLYTRNPQNLKNIDENRETVIKGDTLNKLNLMQQLLKQMSFTPICGTLKLNSKLVRAKIQTATVNWIVLVPPIIPSFRHDCSPP